MFLRREANQCRLCVGVHFSFSLCSLLLATPGGSKASVSCSSFTPVSIKLTD